LYKENSSYTLVANPSVVIKHQKGEVERTCSKYLFLVFDNNTRCFNLVLGAAGIRLVLHKMDE
jgi:hypothetical protein